MGLIFLELNDLIQQIKSYFTDKEVAAIYLFGSYVKGKNRSHSDADIGVLYPSGLDKVTRFERGLAYAVELEELLKFSVDIVDLERADDFFLHQLMLQKIIVLDKDTERRVEFEVRRRREYFDREKFYRMYHQQALKRIDEQELRLKSDAPERI